MYTEASVGMPGDKAVLTTPMSAIKEAHCLEFHYHMFGKHVGSITIFKLLNQKRQPIYTIHGSQGNHWKEMKLNVIPEHGSEMTSVKFEFEVTRGVGFEGDVGIDDVTISRGRCDLPCKCIFSRY